MRALLVVLLLLAGGPVHANALLSLFGARGGGSGAVTAQVPGPSASLFASDAANTGPYYTCTSQKFVSTTGNSGNTGNSTSSPWDIVTAVGFAAPAGTCINVAAGNYTSAINAAGGLGISHGGTGPTSSGYVVWRCAQLSANIVGGTINNEGTGCILGVSTGTGNDIVEVLSGTDFLMMEGFEFAGTASLQAACFDIDFAAATNLATTAHHIWMINNDVHGCGLAGIVEDYTDWMFNLHNLVHDNASTNPLCGSGISHYQPAGLASYTPTPGNPDYWHSATTGLTYDLVEAWNVSVRNFNNNGLACPPNNLPTDGEGFIMDTPDWSGACSAGAGHGAGICPFPGNLLVMGNIMWGNGGRGIEIFSAIGPPAATGHYTVANNSLYSNDWTANSHSEFGGQGYADAANNSSFFNNIMITVTGTRTCVNSGITCSALDEQSTPAGTDSWLTNMTFPSGNTMFDGTDATYPLTGTNHNLDGTNPNLASLTPITNSTGTIAGNFALQSGSAAIAFGQGFDLFQASGAVDAGACPHSLTQCP